MAACDFVMEQLFVCAQFDHLYLATSLGTKLARVWTNCRDTGAQISSRYLTTVSYIVGTGNETLAVRSDAFDIDDGVTLREETED